MTNLEMLIRLEQDWRDEASPNMWRSLHWVGLHKFLVEVCEIILHCGVEVY